MHNRTLVCMMFASGDLALAAEAAETLRRIGFSGPILAHGDGPEASFSGELVTRLARACGISPTWNPQQVGYRANARSLARLLDRALGTPDWDHLVKMDPDALITHPDLFNLVEAPLRSGAGAVGAFRRNAAGGPRSSPHLAWRMAIDQMPLAPCYRPPGNRLLPSLSRPRYLRHAAQARRKGLAPGEHLLGGLYAASRGAIQDALHMGFADDCDGPVGLYSGEDLVLSVYLAAAGHRFAELHRRDEGGSCPGRRAWIQFAAPCRLPAGLGVADLCAIHPVKHGDPLRSACLASIRP
jgi:hypothetical protein